MDEKYMKLSSLTQKFIHSYTFSYGRHEKETEYKTESGAGQRHVMKRKRE